MKRSVWEESCKLPVFDTLKSDESTDVLIIGGGMAGLLCAYFLERAGIKYLLCEANTIASGTTSKTTAVLSAQHDSIFYSELINKFGKEKAKMYLDANLDALEEYKVLSKEFDCNFEEMPSFISTAKNAQLMYREVQALKEIGFNAEIVKRLPLPINFEIAVKFPAQAQFNPLKFALSISNNLNIKEHTMIKKLHGTTAYTDKHKITANKIIVTSHFPFHNTHGMYFTKLYQQRSYVIALENAPHYNGTFVDYDSGLYFRNYKDLLLVGGGDHRTGKAGGGYDYLRRFINENYPEAKEKYMWSAQDCISLDNVPYIGCYSQSLPNVYVATGFNEWGMTTSMLSAKILTNMVLGFENRFAKVFEPSRNMIKKQLFKNLGTTIADYVVPTKKRCTHMGCALKWNSGEHSWDCPCHGSRFSADGHIIDNPATKDL